MNAPVRAQRAVRGLAACHGAGKAAEAPLPDPGGSFLLYAVSTPYAVGATETGPLIQAWDGTEWRNDLHADVTGTRGAALTAVSGAVAVGGAFDAVTYEEFPLLLRRSPDGWVDDEAPDLGFPYVLTGVRGDWAVGHGFPGTVVLRRGEGGWGRVSVPGRPMKLLAVDTLGDRVWAAGARDRDGVIVQFDGRSWTEHKPGCGPVTCLTVVGHDVWASCGRTVLRWSGRKWTSMRAPLPVNALTGESGRLIAAGAGRIAEFDGRNWTARDLPGTWLGADPQWLVGSD